MTNNQITLLVRCFFRNNQEQTFTITRRTATRIYFMAPVDPSDTRITKEIWVPNSGKFSKTVIVKGRKTADNWIQFNSLSA
jgi:hypothetical protein